MPVVGEDLPIVRDFRASHTKNGRPSIDKDLEVESIAIPSTVIDEGHFVAHVASINKEFLSRIDFCGKRVTRFRYSWRRWG